MKTHSVIEISGAPAAWRLRQLTENLIQGLCAGRWVSKKVTLYLSISCVDAVTMTQYNFKYRRKKKPTDVLSFEQTTAPASVELKNVIFLGDLVLCREIVRAQAKEHRHSVQSELAVLLAHGLLHLLGYDHERSAAADKKMAQAEQKLLKASRLSKQITTGLIARSKVSKST